MKRRILYEVVGFFLILMLMAAAGCHKYTPHPGSVNPFDSQAYDVLLIAHNVIESTKTDLANGVFSVAVAPKIKTALNDLIKAYNIADTTYQGYHTAAVAGTATPAQQAAVQSALAQVNQATTTLTQVKAGK